jgi:hypothetical protein
MAVIERSSGVRAAAWGRGIVIGLSLLLVANGVWLFFGIATPGVIEADTGVSLTELRAAYPSVVDELTGRGRTIAVLVAGLGVVALSIALTGLRSGSLTARNGLWAFAVVLLAVGVYGLARGRADVGSFYLLWAVLAALGLGLAARSGQR